MNLQKIKLLAKEGCFHVGNDESYFILKMIDVVEAAKRVLANITGPQNGLLDLHEALKALEKDEKTLPTNP